MTQKPDSSLKTRLKSALIFAPIVLILIYFGGGAFALMMAAGAAVAVNEWARMTMTGKDHPAFLIQLATGLAGLGVLSAGMVSNPVTALCFLLALCFLIFACNFSQGGPSLKLMLGGLVYIGFSFDIMIWLRSGSSGQGLYDFMTLLLIVWASDIAAYFSGKTIGGPKLAPKISPKKTWAGFIGSSVGAGLVAAALACPMFVYKISVDTIGGMGPLGYAVMGAILAMFGQGGDLLVSLFKRHFGVKDTGTLIPGHGGILDRIDALLLVAYIFGCLAVVLP